jgi:hypothetical protein
VAGRDGEAGTVDQKSEIWENLAEVHGVQWASVLVLYNYNFLAQATYTMAKVSSEPCHFSGARSHLCFAVI